MPTRTRIVIAAAVALVLLAGTGLAATRLLSTEKPHAVPPVRTAVTGQQFYFVMADRFANGNPGNDTGGLGDDPLVSGYNPHDSHFYQGGDLAGLTANLDYVAGLGTTAIWLTPSFENKPVQIEDSSAGYHGYWVTDFTSIDPHLGSNEDLRALVDAAHARGMAVYFDIITNHTADVIGFEEGDRVPYVSIDDRPYTDANGTPFDSRALAGTSAFPARDAATSFPYVPVLAPGEENAKTPAWLNDVTLYHNRGNTTFTGEDSQFGDFYGLDDLFTEDPRVIDGMVDIYTTWITDFGIDGFRIDTVKHVDDAFWQSFGPRVLDAAHKAGKKDFFMFGEVYDTSRALTSAYTNGGGLQAVLDFPFQDAARTFASHGGSGSALADFFAGDDWYTDADTSAAQLPTFLGNHDMGRIGGFIVSDNPGISDAEATARDTLAHQLMFLTRGNPVVYYGDEQGFTGAGGDVAARQPMFPTTIADYVQEDLLGTSATLTQDNLDVTHPLYQTIATLSQLTSQYPALRDGAQISRAADGGVYAFSRVERDEQREYVVALNSGTAERTVAIPTWMADGTFTGIYGDDARLTAAPDGTLTVTVPALGAVVYRADAVLPASAAAPQVSIGTVEAAAEDPGRLHVSATVDADAYAEVSFWARVNGTWTYIGTDDAAPYQVYPDVTALDAGTTIEYMAVVADNAGHTRDSAIVTGTVPTPTVAIVSPSTGAVLGSSPAIEATVSPARPGTEVTIERRVGGGAWVPVGTDATGPAYVVRDPLTDIPDGTEVLYRAVAVSGGVTVTSTAIPGKVGASPQPDAVSVPGSFNQELGCSEWWQPSCAAIQMTLDEAQARWSLTVNLPAGEHEFKIAIEGSWTENYGAAGARDGANIPLVLDAPSTVTFTYDHATHLVDVTVAPQ